MFALIERRMCDWFDAHEHQTVLKDGEWRVTIGEDNLSVTAMAIAVGGDLLPRKTSPDNVADYLGNCVDAWHAANPDVTVEEILKGLEELRYTLTEGLLKVQNRR
jgi:hypothetical protein